MKHEKYKLRTIKSRNDFYNQFKEIESTNSNKIYIRRCNIQIDKLRFSIAELKKYITLDDEKQYNIVFENCCFKIFRYIKASDNISLSFISCSSNKITILKSNLHSFVIRDKDSCWKKGHKHIDIQICNISFIINILSDRGNQKRINISKTKVRKILIQKYQSDSIYLDAKKINNITIREVITNNFVIESSLLSDNNISIKDASRIRYMRVEDCNLDNTEIYNLNLSKVYFTKSNISGINLINFKSDRVPDSLQSILFIFFPIIILSIINNSFIFMLFSFVIFYLLSSHKKVYLEKSTSHEESADIYRKYKSIFKSQENIYWYNEMLYAEQLHSLKRKKWYLNFIDLKFYNYIINGFGRRWRRALLWVFSFIIITTSFIHKNVNYILQNNSPDFVEKLFLSKGEVDGIKIDLIYSLSKLDILKIQSSKWFISTDFTSYVISSISSVILLFLVGAFILAFKRRLDK